MIRTTAAFLSVLCLVPAPLETALAFDVQSSHEGPVTEVRSGDTIVVDNIPMRLNGIAAPPEFQPIGGDAKAFLQWLVLEKIVRCDLNGEQTRGRFVAICYLDDEDIGRIVVKEGYARDCPRFSNGRYAKDEAAAKPSGIHDLYPLPEYCGTSL